MSSIRTNLSIAVYADGADLASILKLNTNSKVKGFTTNPTLMRKSGITDYEGFARDLLKEVKTKPVSFEVFADDLDTMYIQAREIASWGENVFVKIPVTNTQGVFTGPILKRLSEEGVRLNVTALMTHQQVQAVVDVLDKGTEAIISVFAGRIADTGRDPLQIMKSSKDILKPYPCFKLLWASPREVLNIYQANDIECDIITVTNDLLSKLDLNGKCLDEFSLETVDMFYRDAQAAGFQIHSKLHVLPKKTAAVTSNTLILEKKVEV